MTSTMETEWSRIAPIAFYLKKPSDVSAATLRREYLNDRPLANDSVTAEALGKLYSDAIIGYGVHSLANALAQYSPKDTYYYQFAYIGNHSHYEDPVTKKPVGAAHHDDLIYLFSINASFPVIPVSQTRDSGMVDQMTHLLYNFAKHGNPNSPPHPRWPTFDRRSRRYLRMGDTSAVRTRLFEDRFRVWERLYRKRDCDICTGD